MFVYLQYYNINFGVYIDANGFNVLDEFVYTIIYTYKTSQAHLNRKSCDVIQLNLYI